jgi:hypothetical protein
VSTATVHTVDDVADGIAETFTRRIGVREAVAHRGLNAATVSVELNNGQRFYLTILEDDTD